jgi:hypothetical protein
MRQTNIDIVGKLRTAMDDTTAMKIFYAVSNLRCDCFRNIDIVHWGTALRCPTRRTGRTQDFRDDTAVDAVRTSMFELVDQLRDKLAT